MPIGKEKPPDPLFPPPPPRADAPGDDDRGVLLYRWPANGEFTRVFAVSVKVVVVESRFNADRGEIVTIASGMPSLFSSTGSAAIVAFGKGTPLTTIVVGSREVTGLNVGEMAALLKT